MIRLSLIASAGGQTGIDWQLVGRSLFLLDYNTRLVVLSTALLGAAAGLVGTFLLLRKRSLIGDALSHATLPGIALAFLVMVALGGSGKSLPGLLVGATVFALIGFGMVMLIRNTTRLKDDAAMGIVLSVLFGLGVALLGVIQQTTSGSAAGLESFIYGKTASMLFTDFLLIAAVAVCAALLSIVLFKEFTLLCFDEGYAKAQGWPVGRLDALMLGLVTAVTVIGLQAVGLILVIAMLIIPPAAARFWSDRLIHVLLTSAAIGLVSGHVGATVSALADDLPAGAVIVLVVAGVFVISMIFGTARGLLMRVIRHVRLRRRVGRQHLLRACFEATESTDATDDITLGQLLAARSWSAGLVRSLLRRARRDGLVRTTDPNAWKLTEAGRREARRVVRNHRLWEMYLVTHADIAPNHVDRDADQIEHVLSSEMIDRLEELLAAQPQAMPLPPSPHRIEGAPA